MAKDGPGGEKTEKPTPQRLKKARKEGQIPRTQELGTWLGVAAASALLPMLVSSAIESVQKLFVQVAVVAAHPEVEAVQELLGAALTAFLTTVLPTAVGMMVVGTVASAAQGGVTFATKSMKPTLKKINPFPGMKRMFGTQGLWEAVKALIKTAALGTVVIIYGAKWFGVAPAQDQVGFFSDPLGNLKTFLAPSLVLGFSLAATVMRMARATVLETLRQDFVRTARSKGLREQVVIYRHVVKNSLIPVITVFGNQFAFLIGGTVVIEQIFSINGIGAMTFQAINQRDYTQVITNTMVLGALVIFVNLLVDISYAWLDPRIRYS